jgi:hypothetical protein
MHNLRESPNSEPGILTVGFNNLEHIDIHINLSVLFIYANLKEQAWNKIWDTLAEFLWRVSNFSASHVILCLLRKPQIYYHFPRTQNETYCSPQLPLFL